MSHSIHNILSTCVLTLTVGLWSGLSLAQNAESQDRKIVLTPYLWGTSISGTSTVPPLPPLDLDASFSDILSNANFAMSLHTEFWFDKWGFVIDPTFIDLEIDVELPEGIPVPLNAPSVDVDIWIVELWAGYQVSEHFEVLGGARYQDQDIAMSGLPSPPLPVDSLNAGDDWTDWFLGFRINADMGTKWLFALRSDITVAGDSDTGFNASVFFNRRIGTNMALNLGYRYFKNDFSSSSYGWDATQDGPVVGYTWVF